jgi:hypothetical protein
MGRGAAHPEQETPCFRLWMARIRWRYAPEAGRGEDEGGNLHHLNPKQL